MARHLQPVDEPFPPEISELLDDYPRQDGYLLSLFRTFANSERFLRKGVGNFLDKESPLPLRVREIVILRVTAHYRCAYEWGVHAAIFAKAARLDDAMLAATTREDPRHEAWSDEERGLILAVDQLCREGRLGSEAKARFEADWALDQQLEIMAIIGNYHTISMVANVAGLSPEPFAHAFPD